MQAEHATAARECACGAGNSRGGGGVDLGVAAEVHSRTLSICPVCRRVLDATVELEDGQTYLRKSCPEHGFFDALVYADAAMYLEHQKFDRPGVAPRRWSANAVRGCPHDCGICPEHRQHTCLAIVEVNTGCNLDCPICFADAGRGYDLTLAQVERMLDRFCEVEAEPEVVQFSGGEPTIHREILPMLRAATARGIRYVMLNTNGLRVARDEKFADALAEIGPLIYLQFDGLEERTHRMIRGRDLRAEKLRALDNLAARGMAAVLVAAIERGINEHEIAPILRFALSRPEVRGVVFQPVTHSGRHLPHDPRRRMTIPDVLHAVDAQMGGVLRLGDFVPIPCCAPTCNSVTWALRDGSELLPLPRLLPVEEYLDYITNRTVPTAPGGDVRGALEALWSAGAVPGSGKAATNVDLACDACGVSLPLGDSELAKRVFMVMVKDFMDAWTMNLRNLQKCCVSVLVPDGRLIPFCAYNNVGYREQVRAALARGEMR